MVTIWVVLVLAGLVLVFSRAMRVEVIASSNQIASLEAEEIVKGAVSFVRARLTQTDETLKLEGETPYKAIPVGSGYFWLLRPNPEDDRTYYYGIRDEAGKLNINNPDLTEEMLLKLPGMAAELAAALIDWRDTDSDVTPGGAENEYYLLLDSPYYCKNGDFESVEELLLLKGATEAILYGEDTNRNGVLDGNENDADASEPDDDRDGKLDRGVWDYVTVHSSEPNTDSSGNGRTNISNGLGQARNALQEVITDQGTLSYLTGAEFRNWRFKSVIDFYIQTRSRVTREQFTKLEDKLTVSDKETLVGLINVNTAPKEVLMCLPGLVEADAEALITAREKEDAVTTTLAWVLDALGDTKADAIGRYITIRSYRYSADVVGASGDGRSYARYKMVADTQDSGFTVISWKALKYLGWPLSPEILKTLRSGGELE